MLHKCARALGSVGGCLAISVEILHRRLLPNVISVRAGITTFKKWAQKVTCFVFFEGDAAVGTPAQRDQLQGWHYRVQEMGSM